MKLIAGRADEHNKIRDKLYQPHLSFSIDACACCSKSCLLGSLSDVIEREA